MKKLNEQLTRMRQLMEGDRWWDKNNDPDNNNMPLAGGDLSYFVARAIEDANLDSTIDGKPFYVKLVDKDGGITNTVYGYFMYDPITYTATPVPLDDISLNEDDMIDNANGMVICTLLNGKITCTKDGDIQ